MISETMRNVWGCHVHVQCKSRQCEGIAWSKWQRVIVVVCLHCRIDLLTHILQNWSTFSSWHRSFDYLHQKTETRKEATLRTGRSVPCSVSHLEQLLYRSPLILLRHSAGGAPRVHVATFESGGGAGSPHRRRRCVFVRQCFSRLR